MIWKYAEFRLLTREGPCHVSGPSRTSLSLSLPAAAQTCQAHPCLVASPPERFHLLQMPPLQRYAWALQIPFCLCSNVIWSERPALTSTYKRAAFLSTPLSLFSPLICRICAILKICSLNCLCPLKHKLCCGRGLVLFSSWR